VDNIISVIDYNGRQIDGDVEDVLSLGNLEAKWLAFGWQVLTMDGHNFVDMKNTIQKSQSLCGSGKPVVIIMKTEMGQGVDYMMGTHKWHGSAPNAEQLQLALNQLEETLGDY
jgi:transketolase